MTEQKKLTWFQLMNKNGYILYFIVGLIFFIGMLTQWNNFYYMELPLVGDVDGRWSILIPIGMMIMIGYKGFYQFWNDYKAGRSR